MRVIVTVLVLLMLAGCDDGTPRAVEPEPVPSEPAAVATDGETEEQPADLIQAIDIAEGWLREDGNVETFRDGEPIDYHHGLGRYMRNEWGLWGDSKLATWFLERGVEHPDDMSMVVLEGLHKRVNGQEIRVEELLADEGNTGD